MKKNQVWEIFRKQYFGVSIVPPATAALLRVTAEEKQEDEHCRGNF